ncbi:MAG: hypothetical protein EP344_06775 [Bacteroidetes bacterium]|nr:MAG: hypothetical protein EP344_06775 [Bacteroidota bacterium]
MKKYLMEGIGTFILVLAVILAIVYPPETGMPLVYGTVLAGVIYAGKTVSGSHFNPAFSLASLMRASLERWDFPYYWIAQLSGSILGALLAAFLIRCNGTAVDLPPLSFDPLCALFAETLGSFMLTLVFLHTSVPAGTETDHAGLAVGSMAVGAAYAFQRITLAMFNPALVLGLAIAGLIAWGEIWAPMIGAFIGAAAAVSVYRSSKPEGE